MDRFQRSWELFKSSLAVMARNKTLLAFPILIAALTIFLVMLFLTPVAFQRTGYSYSSAEHWKAVGNTIYNVDAQSNQNGAVYADGSTRSYTSNQNISVRGVRPLALGYFVLMYFVTMFTATFLNVAFYREILNALNGGPVSLAEGVRFAAGKWKIILMWTLFAGLVGFLIKTLEQRFGIIGQWFMRLVGAVWSVACVFAIPVIVTEEETANPVTVLKKSAVTLTRTWGESLIGYVGVSLGGGIVMLASLLWLGAGMSAAVALHSLWLGIFVGASWLVGICIFSYFMGIASQIFRCALFLYATQGNLPHPYNAEMMALAWKVKKS
jgi:hypothetical protein